VRRDPEYIEPGREERELPREYVLLRLLVRE
jgi:hypothetical protein